MLRRSPESPLLQLNALLISPRWVSEAPSNHRAQWQHTAPNCRMAAGVCPWTAARRSRSSFQSPCLPTTISSSSAPAPSTPSAASAPTTTTAVTSTSIATAAACPTPVTTRTGITSATNTTTSLTEPNVSDHQPERWEPVREEQIHTPAPPHAPAATPPPQLPAAHAAHAPAPHPATYPGAQA